MFINPLSGQETNAGSQPQASSQGHSPQETEL